ncbi:MAG: hypothetical protein ABIR70_21540 [Bryobacteraceae bacterium]
MPTHRAGPDIWQDPIRFKNLLRSAEHSLETSGVTRQEIDSLLRPLTELRDDRKFWQYQADGLAIFRSHERMEEFRLPCQVPELAVVGYQYHLKPFLMSLAEERSFFVLALSQHAVRLFRGTQYGLQEVQGLELPPALDARPDDSVKSLQAHATGAGTQVFHGNELDHKAHIAAYCRKVDHAVATVVGVDDFLVLAAVDYIASLYREVSTLRGIASAPLSGNPDHLGADQIFEKAFPIASTNFEKRHGEDKQRFFNSLGTGRALDAPIDAILAARQGRVETLFVSVGMQIWGAILQGEVRVHEQQQAEDQDLLNGALIDTWKSGGKVLALSPDKMPNGLQLAAITRY